MIPGMFVPMGLTTLTTPAVAADPVNSTDSTAVTTHPFNLPTPVGGIKAGQLLLAFSFTGAGSTVTGPAGWTVLNADPNLLVMYKVAVGGETGPVSFTTAAAKFHKTVCELLTGVATSGFIEKTAEDHGSSGYADAPAISPSWGTSAGSMIYTPSIMINNAVFTAAPIGYDPVGTLSLDVGNLTAGSVCRRNTTIVTEDPPSQTASYGGSWHSLTVAVKGS